MLLEAVRNTQYVVGPLRPCRVREWRSIHFKLGCIFEQISIKTLIDFSKRHYIKFLFRQLEPTNVKMFKAKRVCVIGAGPSGMSVLFHFNKLRKQGKEIPEIVCYDKQSDWGGLWKYSWETGK